MELELVPVSRELADAIVRGEDAGLRRAEGWPHEDTVDGLRMVARGSDCWLVVVDGEVVGDCGTFGPPAGGEVEIGYGLAQPSRGRGIGSRAVAALTDLLLARPDVTRIVATVDRTNVPSLRVLEKAGFAATASDGEQVSYARQ